MKLQSLLYFAILWSTDYLRILRCMGTVQFSGVKIIYDAIMQGQATDMDWTLHTDLTKSETSRAIRKLFQYHLNIFKKCIDFRN